jgi:hypothetical protein
MNNLTRALVATAVALSTLAAGSVPASALTGDYASDPQDPLFAIDSGPADPTGCAKAGVSAPAFRGKVGITSGPHSGRFLHLEGVVTVGPQVHTVDPAADPIYGIPADYGPATDVTGAFTIADFNGANEVVSGTIDGLAAPLGSVGMNIGSCYGVGPEADLGWDEIESGALTAMDLNVTYTYTEAGETRTGTALLRQRQIVGILPGLGTQISYTGGVMNFYSATRPAGLDEAGPEITVTAPAEGATYALGQVVTAQYACVDAVDPAPTCEGPVPSGSAIDTSTPGPHSFTVTSTDDAGNTSTRTVHYTVAASYVAAGFFAPVESDVLNVAKAGQTVPLKFHLTMAGQPVVDLTGVTVKVAGLSCAAGATPDQLEEYATGDKGLMNLGGGSYQFNWATPKSYAGSCKTLTLSAYDAQVTAEFQFRK